jgi:hypothetical protein
MPPTSSVRFAPFPCSLPQVGNTRTGSHSGPKFDKLIPLLEEGEALNLDVPSVCARIKGFVGA